MNLAECISVLAGRIAGTDGARQRTQEASRVFLDFARGLLGGAGAWAAQDAIGRAYQQIVSGQIGTWDTSVDPGTEGRDAQAKAWVRTVVKRKLADIGREASREVRRQARLAAQALAQEQRDRQAVAAADFSDTEVTEAFGLAVSGAQNDRGASFRDELASTAEEVWLVLTGEATMLGLAQRTAGAAEVVEGTRDTVYERVRQRHRRARAELLGQLEALLEAGAVDEDVGHFLAARLQGRKNARLPGASSGAES